MEPIKAQSTARITIEYVDSKNETQVLQCLLRNFDLHLKQDFRPLEEGEEKKDGDVTDDKGKDYRLLSKFAVIHGFLEDMGFLKKTEEQKDGEQREGEGNAGIEAGPKGPRIAKTDDET